MSLGRPADAELAEEGRLRALNDAYDVASHLAKRGRDWLKGNGRVIAENYLHGLSHVEFDLLFKEQATARELYYGVAIVEVANIQWRQLYGGARLTEINSSIDAAVGIDVDRRVSDRHWRDCPVLVDDIEMMDGIQNVIPSSIRLQAFYKVSEIDGALSEFFTGDFRVLGFGWGDREIYPFAGLSMLHSDRAGQVIESAPEIVNGVATSEPEIDRHGLILFDIDTLERAVRLEHWHQGIRLDLRPSFEASLVILDVIQRTVDFGIDASEQRVLHGQS